jgi:hypothetical protein
MALGKASGFPEETVRRESFFDQLLDDNGEVVSE